jgi:predicted site-specific integrase-resolvase
MDYISAREASEKWSISERRIQKLCEEGRIPNVIRFGHSWAIPKNAIKPVDARLKENRKRK